MEHKQENSCLSAFSTCIIISWLDNVDAFLQLYLPLYSHFIGKYNMECKSSVKTKEVYQLQYQIISENEFEYDWNNLWLHNRHLWSKMFVTLYDDFYQAHVASHINFFHLCPLLFSSDSVWINKFQCEFFRQTIFYQPKG